MNTSAARQLRPQAAPTPERRAARRDGFSLEAGPRGAQLRSLQTLADASPRAAQLRSLQTLADASPSTAPLRNLRAAADAWSTPAVVQRVRFARPLRDAAFEGQHFAPPDLPAGVNEALADRYNGVTAARVLTVRFPDQVRDWLSRAARAPIFWRVKAEVLAQDWQGLGRTAPAAIETKAMSATFYDQQHALVRDLRDVVYAARAQGRPDQPIRVASFEFQRQDNGALTTALIEKPIEPGIGEQIADAPLLNVPNTGRVRADVQANVNQTLFAAGQFQWIAANWGTISATHDVFIDVDFYPNRMPSASGLHKDSVGETLFVNLTYDNAEPAQGAEYLLDNTTRRQAGMPAAAESLVANLRTGVAANTIETEDLPRGGRTSFVDPAIWHSTPVYGRRAAVPNYDDRATLTIRQVIEDIRRNHHLTQHEPTENVLEAIIRDLPLPAQIRAAVGVVADGLTIGGVRDAAEALEEPRRTETLRRLQTAILEATATGEQIKQAFRQREPYRTATHTTPQGAVATQLDRMQRRASVEIERRPERAAALRAQAQQPRTFIRTWIILKPRPDRT